MTSILTKRKGADTDTQEEPYVKTEAETAVMQLQDRKHQALTETTRSQEEARKDSAPAPTVLEGAWPW